MRSFSPARSLAIFGLILALSWAIAPAALAGTPTAYAGWDRTVILTGASIVVPFTGATANDPSGFTGLTYAWTPASGSGISSWTARTGSVTTSGSPAAAQVTLTAPGTYTFTLTVTDPTPLIATDTVIISVLKTSAASTYDPPPSYYSAARPGGVWSTGTTLKTALRTIISTGIVQRTYDDARYSLQLLDLDPNNSNNVIEIYNGASVLKTWDSGVTWNREHLWPQSLFGDSSAIKPEEFNLRPCNPSLNSSRGNLPFGTGSGYWDPDHGAPDRGVCARSMFFMETRYSQLTLVNGQPGSLQMGDLASLRTWHYQYPITDRERRRNHLVYSSADNPSYYQGNRNPYVDYPELVWAIWGTSTSDVKLYLGATPPSNGASTEALDLGHVIVGGPLWPAQSVTLHKTGTVPATFAIGLGGAAAASPLGTRQMLVGGTQTQTLVAGLSGPTTTPGTISGTVTIDDTELTSAGTGLGSADGDDVITASGDVRAHAQGSFDAASTQTTLTIDFGSVPIGTGPHTQPVTIYNRTVISGYTAGLALTAVTPAGDTAVLHTDIAPFTNLPAGTGAPFTATLDPNAAAGSYQSTYTLSVADENLPGGAAGTSLLLTLTAQLVPAGSLLGDLNCNGAVNIGDITHFVQALIDPSGYLADHDGNPYALCDRMRADMNEDTLLDGADVQLFVNALIGS